MNIEVIVGGFGSFSHTNLSNEEPTQWTCIPQGHLLLCLSGW